MRLDKFTIKLQEALQEAINLATEFGYQQVDPEHLFYVLLRQEDSIIASALDKLGMPTFSIIKIIEADLENKPTISGRNVQVYFSGRTSTLFSNAAKEARKTFRPEFLNRIDDIIVFNPLTKEDIKKIVDIELEPLYKRLAQQGITLEITQKVKGYLAEKGFDINFGARPLKRTIQKNIQDPLALQLLDGSLKEVN